MKHLENEPASVPAIITLNVNPFCFVIKEIRHLLKLKFNKSPKVFNKSQLIIVSTTFSTVSVIKGVL